MRLHVFGGSQGSKMTMGRQMHARPITRILERHETCRADRVATSDDSGARSELGRTIHAKS